MDSPVVVAPITVVVTILLIAALVVIARNWISEQLKQSIRHGYAVSLEEHKHELGIQRDFFTEEVRKFNTQIQSTLSAANSAVVSGQRVSSEWRMKAASDAWKKVLQIRQYIPLPVTISDILSPDEYPTILTNPRIVTDAQDVQSKIDAMMEIDLGEFRPFIGEDLYGRIFLYRAIVGRMSMILQEGIEKGDVVFWFNEDGLRKRMSRIMTQDQLKELDGLEFGHFSFVTSTIEGEILSYIQKIISGEISMHEGFEQAQKAGEMARDLERDLEREKFTKN